VFEGGKGFFLLFSFGSFVNACGRHGIQGKQKKTSFCERNHELCDFKHVISVL